MPAASARKPRKRPKPRRKSPKPGDAARRKFEKAFRPIVERMVSDAIEDRIDALDGVEALRETGESGHDEFWKKRGLQVTYRIVYEIDDRARVIRIARAGHRRDVDR